jgi:ATP/ADP translocase
MLGWASLLMVFSTTLVDFYYKTYADHRYGGDVEELTTFFGGFYFWVGIATLAAQMVLTPFVLRRATAFDGLLVSPVALAAGALLNLLIPGLWSAAIFKLTDSVLSHSVYRSCQEILYTPLPTSWVERFKSISDGVWGRYGLLLAGLMLMAIAPALERFGSHWLLPVAVISMVAWGLAVGHLRKAYRRQAKFDLNHEAITCVVLASELAPGVNEHDTQLVQTAASPAEGSGDPR